MHQNANQNKGTRHLKCLQVNLHHAKAASSLLCRRFTTDVLDVCFIQEPWCNAGAIKGLQNNQGKVIYDNTATRPRTALIIRKDLKFLPLSGFLKRDLVAIQVTIPSLAGDHEVVIASAYLPGDIEAAPTLEVAELVSYCQKKNLGWIIGCDANAHHTIWGSTNINKRGEFLLEFICKNNIFIVSRGDEPTFRNIIRQEVLDLTLSSNNLSYAITNWHVSNDISLSDHQYLIFDLECSLTYNLTYRNPRTTNWELFCHHLTLSENTQESTIYSSNEIDTETSTLGRNILTAYEESCQLKTRKPKRDVPWWNKGLQKLKAEARRLFNKAKDTGDWSTYKAALTKYNREVRKSKRSTWQTYCNGIEKLPDAVRLQKALSQDHTNGICTLKRPDGTYTESPDETCELLLQTHFPGSVPMPPHGNPKWSPLMTKRNSNLAGKIFGKDRVKWAISTFSPYKSPGPDGILPCFLQRGSDIIVNQLSRLFRSSLLNGYVPKAWREVRVVFIPKAGAKSEQLPKSYRPISLSSFLLKTMEKLIDNHIRDYCLSDKPIHRFQFAYQPGKSTVTAIHHVTKTIEKALDAKQIALCAFIDIQGAFDNTSYNAIDQALIRKNVPKLLRNWIRELLASRVIKLDLCGSSRTIMATKGCPQGGVLSPLLWTLVIDELLEKLNDSGFRTYGYADDLVISVTGFDDATISERMQSALTTAINWCNEKGLSINPAKTILVPFTRRRNLKLKEPTLNGSMIEFSDNVKYLGIILDKTLTWNNHMTYITNKATRASFACRRLFGKTWGLKPKMTYWSFVTIIKPILTYASLVWWTKVEQVSAKVTLNKLYRLVCVSITGAMATCPTLAMGALLHIPPLHLYVKEEASKSATRLLNISNIKAGDMEGHLSILRDFKDEPSLMISDRILPTIVWQRNFRVHIPSRELWQTKNWWQQSADQVWFTDGSKQENGDTGAGIIGPNFQRGLPMGKQPTIFQAEIYAILVCAEECLRRRSKSQKIHIMSDSQASLNALACYEIRSKIVMDCVETLNKLGVHNKLTVCWIPGHEGHEGNERADCLANRGAQRPFIGPEPFFGLPASHFKEVTKSWMENEFSQLWTKEPGLRQTKRFVTLSKRTSQRLLLLERNELRLLTGLLTGHCGLRYHQSKIGNSTTKLCRFCDMHDETSEHILCDCPAIGRRRAKYFGEATMSASSIFSVSPGKILGFINSLNLAW